MSIYVIADLHLSFSQDKPMDIFGDNWENHAEKIKQDWLAKVNDDDTDNYFAEPTARFADIEEDEPVLYPLCNEYDKWFPKND